MDYKEKLIKLLEEYSQLTKDDKIWEYMYKFSFAKIKGSSDILETAVIK